jgi:hypothetical protein
MSNWLKKFQNYLGQFYVVTNQCDKFGRTLAIYENINKWLIFVKFPVFCGKRTIWVKYVFKMNIFASLDYFIQKECGHTVSNPNRRKQMTWWKTRNFLKAWLLGQEVVILWVRLSVTGFLTQMCRWGGNKLAKFTATSFDGCVSHRNLDQGDQIGLNFDSGRIICFGKFYEKL